MSILRNRSGSDDPTDDDAASPVPAAQPGPAAPVA